MEFCSIQNRSDQRETAENKSKLNGFNDSRSRRHRSSIITPKTDMYSPILLIHARTWDRQLARIIYAPRFNFAAHNIHAPPITTDQRSRKRHGHTHIIYEEIR